MQMLIRLHNIVCTTSSAQHHLHHSSRSPTLQRAFLSPSLKM